MIIGLYATVSREQGSLSALRHRAARLLSAGMLSVLALVTLTVAPAAAEPLGAVTVNGMSASHCGGPFGATSGDWCVEGRPIVNIRGPYQINPAFASHPGQREVLVTSDLPRGSSLDGITEVDPVINPGDVAAAFQGGHYPNGDSRDYTQLADFDGTKADCNLSPTFTLPVDAMDAADGDVEGRMKCPTAYPAPDGRSLDLDYTLRDGVQDYQGGLQSLNVEFNYGHPISPCAFDAQARDVARTADDCTPPSHTQITQAKINRNTAFFRFTARHATSFECELLRNKQVMFRRSCHSPKPYANPLRRGQYVFVVTAVNRAGLDRKPATKKFTVR